MQVDALDVDSKDAQQMIIVEISRGTHDAIFQVEHAGSVLPNNIIGQDYKRTCSYHCESWCTLFWSILSLSSYWE